MSCSTCTTASLRAFLTSFAGIDSRRLPRSSQALQVTNPRVRFYKPRFLHGGSADVKLNSLQSGGSKLPSTLDDPFLPFESTLASPGGPPDGTRRTLFDFSLRTRKPLGNNNPSIQGSQGQPSDFSQNDLEPEITLLNPSDAKSNERAVSLSTEDIKAIFNTTKRSSPTPKLKIVEPEQATQKSRGGNQKSKAISSSKVFSRDDRDREPWQIQKRALTEKFGSAGWAPRKRLSPDALEGIRALHAQYPEKYTTPELAQRFQVSPEAIRRILKSKWKPNDEEEEDRRRRWDKRGAVIWSQMVETGIKPPRKWREMGVGRDHVPLRKRRGRDVFDSEDRRHSASGTIPFEALPASQRGASEGRSRVLNRPLSERIL